MQTPSRPTPATRIDEVDRPSDVVWHGELVVILCLADTRANGFEDAVIHFEAAKRAPMSFPVCYALARRTGRQARSAFEPTAARHTIERGLLLTADQILDQLHHPPPIAHKCGRGHRKTPINSPPRHGHDPHSSAQLTHSTIPDPRGA